MSHNCGYVKQLHALCKKIVLKQPYCVGVKMHTDYKIATMLR